MVIVAGLVSGAGANLAWSTLKKAMGAACAGLTLYLGLLNEVVVAEVLLDEAIKGYPVMGALVSLPAICFASRLVKPQI